jgi:hypothetical protein
MKIVLTSKPSVRFNSTGCCTSCDQTTVSDGGLTKNNEDRHQTRGPDRPRAIKIVLIPGTYTQLHAPPLEHLPLADSHWEMVSHCRTLSTIPKVADSTRHRFLYWHDYKFRSYQLSRQLYFCNSICWHWLSHANSRSWALLRSHCQHQPHVNTHHNQSCVPSGIRHP